MHDCSIDLRFLRSIFLSMKIFDENSIRLSIFGYCKNCQKFKSKQNDWKSQQQKNFLKFLWNFLFQIDFLQWNMFVEQLTCVIL